jgi:hypothetical protein
MYYKNTRIETVVDFVEAEIQIGKPTQAIHLYKRMGGIVTAIAGRDKNTGLELPSNRSNATTDLFRFRIQDPNNFVAVKEICDAVHREYPFSQPPTITAIELAQDTYCPGANVKELAEIASDRYRFTAHTPSHGWYFYRRQGDGRHYVRDDHNGLTRWEIVKMFEDEHHLTDSNSKGVDVRYHAYVKVRDYVEAYRDNGEVIRTVKELDPKHRRARVEITLRGQALPCRTMEELENIDFARLAKYFTFRKLDDKLHPAARYGLEKVSGRQLGRRGRYRRKHPTLIGRHSGSSVYRQATIADEALNTAVYECLRRQSRKWRRSK